MHHLYPLAKGDPLCPLGFHPQVRWPTRCKRCFRDYKEHGSRRRDEQVTLKRGDATSSTPSLSTWGDGKENARSWSSSSNLAFDKEDKKSISTRESGFGNPSSWESTPDLSNLNDDTQANIPTVNIKLPKRKQKPIDTGQRTVSDSFSIKQDKASVFNKNDSLATRAKKLQMMKDASSQEKSKRIHIKEIKAVAEEPSNNDVKKAPTKQESDESAGEDEDAVSLAGTETTDTTLVDHNESELVEQVESLKKELDITKAKCERLEKEKSNILLRRLTAMETTSSKNTAAEVLKLQQRCNELQSHLDDYKDEKKILSLKVKELEEDLETRPTAQQAQKIADELRSKLLAAETLCEELMDENEDMKKELRDLEDEMEEMQDNFREDQADEYTSLKKELEQTTKNCRILSFKLRKTERKVDQLETEKGEAEKKLQEVSIGQTNSSQIEKIKNLEKELATANEKASDLQKQLDESKSKSEAIRQKPPMLGSIGRFSSDGKVSRESLTRGGSQEDPVQLLRDLQDSLEREADLREQLKFAEEEAQNLRKKASRIEDDNESLVLQLKKMATRARSRKLSPTNNRLSADMSMEKDEGISDDEDIAELKLQLELSEQEASVLRKKVEELEAENDRVKKKTKELQEKLTSKSTKKSLFGSDKEKQDDKIKGLEDDIRNVRRTLLEKERECERLVSELNLSKKRSTEMQKVKSLDMDQATLDLKRQLQVIEQEALVFRTRVQNLENENEKLTVENKRLQLLRSTKTLKSDKSMDKYIDQIATLEVELQEANDKVKNLEVKLKSSGKEISENSKLKSIENERDNLANTLTKLKQDSLKAFKDRIPKKPADSNSKLQLKTMVNDLENEIGEILVVLNNSETSKLKLEKELQQMKSQSSTKSDVEGAVKELEAMKKKLSTVEKELKTEKAAVTKEKTKCEDLNKKLVKSKDALNTAKEENDKVKNENEKILEEKKKMNDELSKLKSELSLVITSGEDAKKIKSELDKKEMQIIKYKSEIEEKGKEVDVKMKKINNLEKQLQAAEEKVLKTDKDKKLEIKRLEAKLEEEKSKSHLRETQQAELSDKWKDDSKSMNDQIEELNNNIQCLETTIKSKNLLIQQLEESLKKERAAATSKNNSETKQIKDLCEELEKSKKNLSDVESKLETAQKSRKAAEDKLKRTEGEFKTDKLKLEKNISTLENDLQSEKKKIEVLKSNYEKEHKNRELELGILRNKIKSLEINSGNGNKKITEIKQEYQEKIYKLEATLTSEKKEYANLTAKYEILEEEHVGTKAKLVTEKESLNNQLLTSKKEIEGLEKELETLRETYNTKHDTWIKEKVKIQEKLKEYEKLPHKSNDLEKVRLKSLLEEAQLDVDQIKKEYEVINDQMVYMRKENEELRKKLDDFDKVSKIQRNISADSSAMEKEIRELKIKLSNAEKVKKSDLAEYKLRYESQIHVINEELRSLQSQVTRFKRERDTYKHMLEGAQKTISDLKISPTKFSRESRNSITSLDEIDEFKNKIATLEQQISCMEDELSEARLESSKQKTELVSERSTYEVKLSELQSRVNELEEDKILSSGRTKLAGLRTKLELAWQKEREEQQRLLQETATLARDLRQTLYEVERERDKERLESRRKQEQLKKTTEEEHEEMKKKLTEMQCDLLELRDAHAKLRTTNEKLRREKERHEKDREELKNFINGKRKTDQEDDRRVSLLIEQVEALMQIVPEMCSSRDKEVSPYTPTPPRRIKGPKSRESSPAIDGRSTKESSLVREDRQDQFRVTLQRLVGAADDLRKFQKLTEEDRERERIKRVMGMRRATSTENDNSDSLRKTRTYVRNGGTGSSLYRKSLSLEQTSVLHEQSIWKGDSDSTSSMQSLDFTSDAEGRYGKREVSLDSRLSGGSTQSETTGQDKKKKKSLIGKLKQLTKSRSIDDQDPGHFSSAEGLQTKPSSNSDIADETRGSKRDLKERLTGMFKRSGSSSRSNSLERQNKPKDNTSSTQRPLMPNGSNTNMSSSSSKSGNKSK